jgi:multiple antibiotic resistance protein
MFAGVEAGQNRFARLADATKAAVAVLVILVIAALAGARVLKIFGESLDAFAVAGGGVLSWIGLRMVGAKSARDPNPDPSKEDASTKQSITPLILFATSPGTITGVITLAVAHSGLVLPVTALVAVAVATGVMWIVMVLMPQGGTQSQGGFVRDTATRFMGLIIVAMGVQFALTGIRSFFAAKP